MDEDMLCPGGTFAAVVSSSVGEMGEVPTEQVEGEHQRKHGIQGLVPSSAQLWTAEA